MAVDPLAGSQTNAPALIRVPGNGTNTISYPLPPAVNLTIEAISVDANASASGGSTITAVYITPPNQTVAESSSAAQIPAGTVCEVTFAPFLPDTAAVGALAAESQLQTGLVLTELAGGSTVEIVATDPAVILTEARIWATGAVGDGADVPPPLSPIYLTPVSGEVVSVLA